MRATTQICAALLLVVMAEVVSFSTPHGRGISLLHTTRKSALHVKVPVFDEVCDTTGVTLKRFMSEVVMLNPDLEEVQVLFGAIETACKAISNAVKRSQLPSGYDGNALGEDSKTLDLVANDVLKQALRFTGRLGVLASEEEADPVSLSSLSGPQGSGSGHILFSQTASSNSHSLHYLGFPAGK